MIKFTLPNFFDYFYINQFFITLSKSNPNFFKKEIAFIQHSGPFPYLSWNGGFNCNSGGGAYYTDFTNCYRLTSLPIRFNMANVLLEEFDYNDNMGNSILETNHNGSNLIEISNLDFMEKIAQQYPNYKFVLSKQADLITPFSSELLNSITEADKFFLIGLPDKFNKDFDFLQSLKRKKQFEITVNPLCSAKCKHYDTCLLNIHKLQLEYSGQQPIQNCLKSNHFNNFEKLLSLEEIEEKYIPLGFSHFTFSSVVLPASEVFSFYTKYFIKEEYQQQVMNMFNVSGGVMNGR